MRLRPDTGADGGATSRGGAFPCGFRAPGMITIGSWWLRHESMSAAGAPSGNICRCTGYTQIIRSMEKTGEDLT
ncbi:2Fe-2S iron-sulfur cluster-binding protein [Thermoactinospora rubra]|uniref:2Fe-2S iron-sulfur cluster-binding protein n=1 Tax=Thermoactinospora rubra TaxID=1088767 RepID=UPI003B84B554